MNLSRAYMPHSVTVRPYAGRSSTGPVFGAEFPLQCMAQGARRLVRNAEGTEVVSSLTLIAEAGQAATIPPGSQVEWKGATTVVIASTDHDDGGMGAPQHTEVVCE